MKVRPASSFLGLGESMERVSEVADAAALKRLLIERYIFPQDLSDDRITIEPYARDDRIGWDTHLICVDGNAVLFSDGPMPVGESHER